jgi:hypothetical protein
MGHYNPDTEEDIKICTATMKNFFTYLLYHSVCPEQKEDLEQARRNCDKCEKELWMTQQLVHNDGPGHFNRGCSMLFGGYYFESIDDPDAWTKVRWANPNIFTRQIARKVVKYAIAIAGDDHMTRKFKVLVEWNHVEAKQIPDIDGFEVISIQQPSEMASSYYKILAPDLLPVGKFKAKEFRDPARGPFDLKPWEKVDWECGFAPTYNFEFFVEAPLLALIVPGMKFITAVFETNFGMHFYDEVMAVLPTNYLFLYNDWMMGYKEPKSVDWIGDEKEIERRKADELVIPPPEFSEAEWVLHVLTKEMKRFQNLKGDPEGQAKLDIKGLECAGVSMTEIKEELGISRPSGKKRRPKEAKKDDDKQVPANESVEVEAGEEEAGEEEAVEGSVEKATVKEETIKRQPVDEPVDEPVKEEAAQEKVIKGEPVRVQILSRGTGTIY